MDLIPRLLFAEDAQDVIEYALLTAGIGIVSIAVWPLIAAGIGNWYAVMNNGTQNIWEVPNPGSN